MPVNKPQVLCVDDEKNVLEGLVLDLRKQCDVRVAMSGAAGLEMIQQRGPFAVVLSDMRMPEMNGATFLSRVRSVAPDTVRMLLTGQANLDAAIAAVNEGQIFRFLTKPCPPDQLKDAFEAAVQQHRLLTAERVLLEQTLRGSMQALTEVLALTNPMAFGRATRVKQYVSELVHKLEISDPWQAEVAAMLSQLGYIALPRKIVEKLYYGEQLGDEEQAMVDRAPKVLEQLLGHIPRLESVVEILTNVDKPFKHNGVAHTAVPVGARMLRIANDFGALEAEGHSTQLALDTMRGRSELYDPEILNVFAELRGVSETQNEVKELALKAVQVGMVFAQDVTMNNGALLVARGYEVTPSFLERARNFGDGRVKEPVKVFVRNLQGKQGT